LRFGTIVTRYVPGRSTASRAAIWKWLRSSPGELSMKYF